MRDTFYIEKVHFKKVVCSKCCRWAAFCSEFPIRISHDMGVSQISNSKPKRSFIPSKNTMRCHSRFDQFFNGSWWLREPPNILPSGFLPRNYIATTFRRRTALTLLFFIGVIGISQKTSRLQHMCKRPNGEIQVIQVVILLITVVMGKTAFLVSVYDDTYIGLIDN